eukprot:TRINITY_DN2731_c0_g5_i2.p1 TRINITY_DN2731_c0_g5~~TRINITY_DN2731_c0_g5_i2.p1  ORF type:complete len:273 (-),score=44.91 TRINITY_DN2731_c0_g5_i2:49-867(-)
MSAPEYPLADVQAEESRSAQSPHTTHLHCDLSLQALDSFSARSKRKELSVETLSTVNIELIERVAKRQLLVMGSSLASVNIVNGVMAQGLVEESKDRVDSEVSALSGTKFSERVKDYGLDNESSVEKAEDEYKERDAIELKEEVESLGNEIKLTNAYADMGEHSELRSEYDINKTENVISEQAQENLDSEERAKAEEGKERERVEFCSINIGDAFGDSHKSEKDAMEIIDKENNLFDAFGNNGQMNATDTRNLNCKKAVSYTHLTLPTSDLV